MTIACILYSVYIDCVLPKLPKTSNIILVTAPKKTEKYWNCYHLMEFMGVYVWNEKSEINSRKWHKIIEKKVTLKIFKETEKGKVIKSLVKWFHHSLRVSCNRNEYFPFRFHVSGRNWNRNIFTFFYGKSIHIPQSMINEKLPFFFLCFYRCS